MLRLRLTILVVCLASANAVLAADGSVHLYLQPLPTEAARLTFTIASVSAVTATGTEVPLNLSLKTVSQTEAGRQRLLASGRVPAGSYAAFIFKIKQAALKSERGDVTLVVPDAPVRLDLPYSVTPQQGAFFWLTLKYQDSPAGGYEFHAAFSGVTPPKAIPDHAGFVTNSGSQTITVFDKSIGQAVAVLNTCGGPAGMALDQNRRRMYVACAKDDEIQSIDIATGEILERGRLSPGDRPREIALTPDGTTLVSANSGSNSVAFFDAVTLNRQDRLNVGSGPGSIVIDATGRRAFVFNTLSGSVSVIDIGNRTVVATISIEATPLRGKLNARGDRLYVIHERSPYMTVLDPTQLTVVNRARLRIGVSAIEVDPVRNLVSIGSANDTTVEFYDPNALLPLYSMRTRSGVSYLRIDADANTLYMVSPDTRSVLVGRLADRKVVSEIDVDDAPYCVAVVGEK